MDELPEISGRKQALAMCEGVGEDPYMLLVEEMPYISGNGNGSIYGLIYSFYRTEFCN